MLDPMIIDILAKVPASKMTDCPRYIDLVGKDLKHHIIDGKFVVKIGLLSLKIPFDPFEHFPIGTFLPLHS